MTRYGQILFYRSLSEFLRKEVGVDVQLQAVQLLFLLLNCRSAFSLHFASVNIVGLIKVQVDSLVSFFHSWHVKCIVLHGD